MAIETDATLKTYFETNDIPTQQEYENLIDSKVNVLDTLKLYVAQLVFNGANDPVPTIIKNTLGADIVWTRTGTGTYRGTLVGTFVVGKTFIIGNNPTIAEGSIGFSIPTIDYCDIACIDWDTVTYANANTSAYLIKIEVYQ